MEDFVERYNLTYAGTSNDEVYGLAVGNPLQCLGAISTDKFAVLAQGLAFMSHHPLLPRWLARELKIPIDSKLHLVLLDLIRMVNGHPNLFYTYKVVADLGEIEEALR